MISDTAFWNIVNATGFPEHRDYKKTQRYLNKYFNDTDLEALRQKSKQLQAVLEVKIHNINLGLGNDSTWDLLATVVGMGVNAFYDVLGNPEKILDYIPLSVENFDYAFNSLNTVQSEVSTTPESN